MDQGIIISTYISKQFPIIKIDSLTIVTIGIIALKHFFERIREHLRTIIEEL